MTLEWVQKLEKVESRAALVDFVRYLIEVWETKGAWPNRDAGKYLEALSAWLAESDAYYAFRDQSPIADQPRWNQVAEMLLAATYYE